MALSYMEEQRKQGEADIKVLKKRIKELQSKVTTRQDVLETQMDPDHVDWHDSLNKDFKVKMAQGRVMPGFEGKAEYYSAAQRRARKLQKGGNVPKTKKKLQPGAQSASASRLASSLGHLEQIRQQNGSVNALSFSNYMSKRQGGTDSRPGSSGGQYLLRKSLSAQLLRGRKDSSTNLHATMGIGPMSQDKQRRPSSSMMNEHPAADGKKAPKQPRPRQQVTYKSSLLSNKPSSFDNSIQRQLFEFTSGDEDSRVVESLTYSADLEENFHLSLPFELETALKKAAVSNRYRSDFHRAIQLPATQRLANKLFWFLFCKYFEAHSEQQQDSLVVAISRCYTELCNALLLIFPPDLNRQVIRFDKDKFLTILPFLLAEALYQTYVRLFPGNKSYFRPAFRDRLDKDMNLLLGGVQLCATTQIKQRAKIFPISDELEDNHTSDADDDDCASGAKPLKKKKDKASVVMSSKAIPLQDDLLREEAERKQRRKNRRMRPQTVKFNTNLLTPVLQRGLERWTAVPSWQANRLISHSMPRNDSLLGGENTFVEFLSAGRKEYQSDLINETREVRKLQEKIFEGREESAEERKDMFMRRKNREASRLRALKLTMSPSHFYHVKRPITINVNNVQANADNDENGYALSPSLGASPTSKPLTPKPLPKPS